MSFNRPTVNQIIPLIDDKFNMKQYLSKHYLNLAQKSFKRKYGRYANLDDAQLLYNEFVIQWKHYYITKPCLHKLHKKLANPLWKFGCSIKISVKDSTKEFVRTINPTFKNVFEYHYDSWIIRNNKFEEYKEFAIKNLKKFPYVKETYVDYSSQAFNNITEDF